MTPSNQELLDAINSADPVTGLTHNFYRYPARFSPQFTRAMIQAFTQPGDLVYDPFMGGGTTLVEASAQGRDAIGTDINSLAAFLARVKTTRFTRRQLLAVQNWASATVKDLQWFVPAEPDGSWSQLGYYRNINTRGTWRIRKLLEIALATSKSLDDKTRQLARCILLRTAQWALDCRKDVPTPTEFRCQFVASAKELTSGAAAYAKAVSQVRKTSPYCNRLARPVCLHRSVVGIESNDVFKDRHVSLVLTSPPYPGVHVLYHRWQVQGRRETSAPYWIANSLDGHGGSYYTFGDRREQDLTSYFNQAQAAFESIAKICNKNTLIVQMLAFSEPERQLQRYAKMLNHAGFIELKFAEVANARDGRIWRHVPNRKWYATRLGSTPSSSEVVLFHKLR